MKRNTIRIALQKSGRLRDDSLALLKSRGLICDVANDREIITPSSDVNVEFLFVRQYDIPQYVQCGAADFGIVGRNTLYENDYNVTVLEELRFGECRLIVAVPIGSPIVEVGDLDGERIATSYPNSVRKLLDTERVNAAIVDVTGSVEVTPRLGLADAICDITQTGDSLRANGLREVVTLLRSRAVIIESPYTNAQKTAFKNTYAPKGSFYKNRSKS
jgi:ATP phosphoribosyltransferase